jgi:RHS repeat-associated protein
MRKEVETLMTKVNKINSRNIFSLYHRSLPLYKRRPNRRKNISPGESGKLSGKELDPETGFYYYGARYLDPRTSRWLSGDPALGEYLPAAPVNDEVKKGNGNLPGQGGVFNLVNLHVYHYAGNNPVKYVDPDGRDSGYAMDENAVSGAGHAGWFVGTGEGRYAFYEVTGLNDTIQSGDQVKKDDREGIALSNSPLKFPTGGSAKSVKYDSSAGVVRRDFDTWDDMVSYLGSAGKNDGYDSMIVFNTTPEQDKIIANASENIGANFSGYNVIGNNCGTIARDVLTTPGSGIVGNTKSSIPNTIGKWLSRHNTNAYKLMIP